MFRYEKDMIPILRDSLSRIFNTNYFIQEFPSGLGVADLVFTTFIQQRSQALQDFESMYYLNKYFSTANMSFCIKETVKKYSLNKLKAKQTIDFLLQLQLLREEEKGKYTVDTVYTPSTGEIFAIEAKLKDWRSGLFQALRYKQFAHKTYLAIDATYSHRVNMPLLKQNNVGLIEVTDTDAKILFTPKNNIPINQTAYYHFSEKFVSRFSKCHS
jgi:hypothetical protein